MRTLDLTEPVTSSFSWDAFKFPDGQPHISVETVFRDDRGPRNQPVQMTCRLTSGDELLQVLLAADALRRGGWTEIHLRIRYLMGARMDRPIPLADRKVGGAHIRTAQPFTLKVVADVLKTGGFASITVDDPHSDVSVALLDAQVPSHTWMIQDILNTEDNANIVLVSPDAGATKKVETLASELVTHSPLRVVHCMKHRDMATGKLSGFQVMEKDLVNGARCLIVDDICDGGGTFAGIAAELRAAGAKEVLLFVTHGIFSKGFDIAGIDRIYTTTTYQDFKELPEHVKVLA